MSNYIIKSFAGNIKYLRSFDYHNDIQKNFVLISKIIKSLKYENKYDLISVQKLRNFEKKMSELYREEKYFLRVKK